MSHEINDSWALRRHRHAGFGHQRWQAAGIFGGHLGAAEISLSYLEQLFAKLRREELVTSARGPGGGYRLARSGAEIFVAEIIDAVDESVDVTNCQGKGNCHHGETCLTHHLWEDLSGQIHDFLSQISLAI